MIFTDSTFSVPKNSLKSSSSTRGCKWYANIVLLASCGRPRSWTKLVVTNGKINLNELDNFTFPPVIHGSDIKIN